MSEPPEELNPLTMQAIQMLRTLQRNVMPKNLQDAIADLRPNAPVCAPADLLARIDSIQDDQTLRLFLCEQASREELFCYSDAVSILEELLRTLDIQSQMFHDISGGLLMDMRMVQAAKVGLQLLARLDRKPAS